MARQSNQDSEILRLLPASLRDMAEQIGVDAALLLADKAGGTRLSIPRSIKPGSALTKLVGIEIATQRVEILGGERPFIPFATKARLFHSYCENLSVSRIARRVHLSERSVYDHLKQIRETGTLYGKRKPPRHSEQASADA